MNEGAPVYPSGGRVYSCRREKNLIQPATSMEPPPEKRDAMWPSDPVGADLITSQLNRNASRLFSDFAGTRVRVACLGSGGIEGL